MFNLLLSSGLFWVCAFCCFKSLQNFLKGVPFRLNPILVFSAQVSVKPLNECTTPVYENNFVYEKK